MVQIHHEIDIDDGDCDEDDNEEEDDHGCFFNTY